MQVYRFLTGTDDDAFCHRVTRELSQGWQLHGPPSLTFDPVNARAICGQAIVKDIPEQDYDPALDLRTIGDVPATVSFSRYGHADRDGVARLIVPIQQDEFGIPITLEDQPDLLDIAGYYQTGAGDFWVARAGGAIVGTIGLKEFAPGEAALRKMFVAKAHRGQADVAAQLLTGLLETARDRGIKRIVLGTTTAFKAALRFYEKHGFTAIGEEALPNEFPRMAVDTRFYAKEL